MANEAKNPVQTTRRSLDIIETLLEMDGAHLTALADRVDLPNSTVHSHLSTLAERGYVFKDGDVYRVSLRFLELSEKVRTKRRVYEHAKPEIDELANETCQVANLLVEEDGWGVYLYSSRGKDAVPLDIHPGKHVHLHSTALGKCILASLPENRTEEILSQRGLPSVTDNTITDRETLFAELERVRERRFAIDDEEQVTGMRCVATAVTNESGEVIGGISVSGPTSVLTGDTLTDTVPDYLFSAVNVIELKVAYS